MGDVGAMTPTTTDYEAERAGLLQRVADLDKKVEVQKALDALAVKHQAEFAELATQRGFTDLKEMQAWLQPKAAAKPVKARASKQAAKAAPKKRAKRTTISDETKAKIREAWKARGDKTAPQLAKEHGLLTGTFYKIATSK